MGAKLNLDETELDKNNNLVTQNDDDEDVVFEQTFTSAHISPELTTSNKQSNNKKTSINNSNIREYKTII